MRRTIGLFGFLAAALAIGGVAQAEVVAIGDASFENAALNPGSGYCYSPTGCPSGNATVTGTSAWTFGPGGGLAGNGSAFNNPDAVDGTQAAFLQGGGSISQALALNPGDVVQFTFWLAGRGPQDGPNEIGVYLGATQIGDFTPVASSYQQFTTDAFTVTGTGEALSFVGLAGDGDHTSFVDVVSGDVTPAPEPGTLGLLGAALAGLGCFARKRRA